jgi:hypothetical protein
LAERAKRVAAIEAGSARAVVFSPGTARVGGSAFESINTDTSDVPGLAETRVAIPLTDDASTEPDNPRRAGLQAAPGSDTIRDEKSPLAERPLANTVVEASLDDAPAPVRPTLDDVPGAVRPTVDDVPAPVRPTLDHAPVPVAAMWAPMRSSPLPSSARRQQIRRSRPGEIEGPPSSDGSADLRRTLVRGLGLGAACVGLAMLASLASSTLPATPRASPAVQVDEIQPTSALVPTAAPVAPSASATPLLPLTSASARAGASSAHAPTTRPAPRRPAQGTDDPDRATDPHP